MGSFPNSVHRVQFAPHVNRKTQVRTHMPFLKPTLPLSTSLSEAKPMADPPSSPSVLLDRPFHDLFPDDLPLLPSDLRDLDFDFDFNDFSVDDFICSPEDHAHHHHPSSHASPAPHSPADGSAVSSSSSPGQDRPEPADRPSSPNSGDSSAASGVFVVDREVKAEEDKTGYSVKRKIETDDRKFSGRHADLSPNPDSNPRSSKFRRSEEACSPCVFGSGGEEEDKRRARLMRNRESAQLSRQRKKQYVEELEDKVRAMHSTITELNTKISYFMAENASLRQQLGGNGAPPAIYPPPGAMAPMHFPWIPGYALRPQGSQVPLVPIPRMKPQQPAPSPKAKKSESKKSEHKTKKVASVSLLGLLFVMLIFGGVPGVKLRYGRNEVDEGQFFSQGKGRVLSVRGRDSALNSTDGILLCSGKKGFREGSIDRVTGRRCENVEVGQGVKPKGSSALSSSGSEAVFTQNSSENLPALLYVPRNGKHVKINGNLIIHSVLASEKAMQQAKERRSSGEEGKKTGLAVAGSVMSALAISKSGTEADQHSKSYRIASDSDDTYVNNLKSTSPDGPLQQWFREGMAGPILNSGMCTEVFQFDVSPPSSSGIIPTSSIINASSIVNASENLPPHSARPGKIKSRRMMYPEPIPLRGTTINNTQQFEKSSESSNFHNTKPVSSVVVSVLADPREAGDGENDGRVSPNSLSRIFVVVLMDSVKYVTYSCVLPFKTSAPHLVN